jgi:ABC-type transporter Mla subunit MlaD
VPCGFVQSISIAPDGNLVQIIIKVDKGLKINDSLVVKLEMAGFAGGKYLQLTSNASSINDFEYDFPLPYTLIKSAPSQIDELAQSAEAIISDLKYFQWKEISENLVGTLQGTNKLINNQDLVVAISDLSETTRALSILVTELNNSTFTGNIEATSVSVAKAAEELNKFSVTLNSKLENIDIPQYMDLIYKDINTTMKSASNAIDAITNKFQSSMLGINILLEDVNHTNKALQNTLRNLNESPYLFLTEPPPPEKINVKNK